MNELFDIQVNAQKEKGIRGSRKLPQAHEKVRDENERRKETNRQIMKKNDARVQMLFMEGGRL